MKRSITVTLDAEDYQRLVVEARRLGMRPSLLAVSYLHTRLAAESRERGETRRAGLAALDGLAHLRARLPDCGPIDVVQLVRDGRVASAP